MCVCSCVCGGQKKICRTSLLPPWNQTQVVSVGSTTITHLTISLVYEYLYIMQIFLAFVFRSINFDETVSEDIEVYLKKI